jgi:hypothetical protein
MRSTNPEDARSHLAGLALANEFEISELRGASVDLKLRQLWTLMNSADLFENPAQREAEVREIRERWVRFRQTRNV